MPDLAPSVVLVVDDDPDTRHIVRVAVEQQCHRVIEASNGSAAMQLCRSTLPDVVVTDVMMPEMDGNQFVEAFREEFGAHFVPILMLTAFDELEDNIQGFNSGTDDYLTKPFYMKELIMRVQSLIKRKNTDNSQFENSETLVFGDLIIQTKTSKVTRQGVELTLTAREYQILVQLVLAKGELVLKRDLIKEIWGSSFDANTNTIEVYINFLRKKVDKPFGKDSIKTKIGFGYYFEDK